MGVPVAVLGIILVTTLPHGTNGIAATFGQDAEPYIIYFTPAGIGLIGYILYKTLPAKVIVPCGVIGWIVGLSLIYWYYWFGPGSFGHHS